MAHLLEARITSVEERLPGSGGNPPPHFPENGHRRRGDGGELPLVKIGDPLRMTYHDSTVDALLDLVDGLRARQGESSSAELLLAVRDVLDVFDEATRSRVCRFAIEGQGKQLHPVSVSCLASLGFMFRCQPLPMQRLMLKLHDTLGLLVLESELYVSRHGLDVRGLVRRQLPLFALPGRHGHRDAAIDLAHLQRVRERALRLLERGVPSTLDEYTHHCVSDLLLTAPDADMRGRGAMLLHGCAKQPDVLE